MKIFFRNIIAALKDQGPPKRFFYNFIVTRNAWGLFSKNSHIAQRTGELKIKYNTKKSATKAALAMTEKYGGWYSNYKCLRCDGYHVGRTRNNSRDLSRT